MKQIVAMVKPFRAEQVVQQLAALPFEAIEVSAVKGYSRQKSYLDHYAGSEYSTAFLPKVQITAWVEDAHVELVVRAMIAGARTGRIGDGKILVLPTIGDACIDV